MNSIQFNFWAVLISFGALQGFFLSLTLFVYKKGEPKANRLLSLLLFVVSFLMTGYVFEIAGIYERLPHLISLTSPFWYLVGPLFYIYVRQLLLQSFVMKKRDLIHFLLFFIAIIYFMPFYLLSAQEKLDIYNNFRQLPPGEGSLSTLLIIYINVIQILVYTFISIRFLDKLGGKLKIVSANTEIAFFDWLKKATLFFFVYIVVDTTAAIFFYITRLHYEESVHLSMLTLTAFVHFVGYFAIFHHEKLFPLLSIERPKYEKSTLKQGEIKTLAHDLLDIMNSKKPYLNSELKLSDLSEMLNIPSSHLSQILNTELNTNFYDFINEHRVKEMKECLFNPGYQNFTILAIAYEVGFSSKTSFNRIFKKHTGKTPSEFMKQNSIRKLA